MKYRTVKDDDYIYQDPESLLTGVDPNSKTISKRWGQFLQRYRRRTGDNIKTIRLHDLRHTNADICREGGVDMFGIAYHLGHSLIGVNTFRYLHDDGLYGRKEICEAVNNSIKTEIKRHDFNNK